ncbi:bifunctional UDP-sugar hydrolase/5'-nucleotidase UshA [Shewanella putrefaciens]
MINKLIKGLVATAVLAALAGCNNSDDDKIPTTCAEAGSACTTFTVLHTNDNHGRFWQSEYGEYGMAARKTLIEQIRNEVKSNGSQVLLLDGGDVNTGVPESDMQDAVPDFIGMNLIGYDAMAVGNHEFDNPLDILEMQRKLADFPMLAANIYDKVSGKRYFDAYKIFHINGLRIAVIGLTTVDTAKIGNPEYLGDLEFTDPQTEIKKVIKEIKDAKAADLIFATTHMGHYANAAHGSNAPGDVSLARSLNEGDLHAIIGGHSQNPVCMEPSYESYAKFTRGDECKPDQQKGTYIMQAHEWGKYVGRADFEYFNGKLHLASYKLVPVNLMVLDANGTPALAIKGDKKSTTLVPGTSKIDENLGVLQVLKPYQDKGQELLDVVIGNTDGMLVGERNIVRFEQTNLGRLLARAQSQYKLVNSDFGIMNSGGVRASIPEGKITYRDVLTVQPFGNMVAKATMKGDDISTYLSSVATINVDSGGYAQFDGIKMAIDCDTKKVTINDINNKGFSENEEYTFSISTFSAAGGDKYPVINAVSIEVADALVLRDFIETQKDIKIADFNPVAGDITYTAGGVEVKGCPAVSKP